MRLDELFTNLGMIAGTIATQLRDVGGVPLDELDLSGAPPREVVLAGSAQAVVEDGEVLQISVEAAPGSEEVRFVLRDGRLRIGGGGSQTIVRIELPAPRKLSLAGSGRLRAARLARDGQVAISGSGRMEIARAEGGNLDTDIAGSGRLMVDGQVDGFDLSIAGSGSCDGDGRTVARAHVSIAGSGDAIFHCDGEVEANLVGSGTVIVRGSARCRVTSTGSGSLTCERPAHAG